MFIIKISFSIVFMLSVAHISAGRSDDEVEIYSYGKCIKEMTNTFVNTATTPMCVDLAITDFKLFGADKCIYDVHVKMYYEILHFYIDPSRIETPEEYCSVWKKKVTFRLCLDSLNIFLDDMGFDDLLPKEPPNYGGEFTEEEQDYLIGRPPNFAEGSSSAQPIQYNQNPLQDDTNYQNQFQGAKDPDDIELSTEEYNFLYGLPTSYTGGIEDLINPNPYSGSLNPNEQYPAYSSFEERPAYSSFGDLSGGSSMHNPSSGSSSTQEPDIRKSRILKNALYYHRVYRQRDELKEDQQKYLHRISSRGERYLLHIAKHIKLIAVADKFLDSPWNFCKRIYNV